MQRVEKWTKRIAESKHGLWLIGLASFLETIIIPIPIELVLIPYMVINRKRVWLIATVTTIGCLLGAIVGYGFGYFLFESAGRWLIEAYDYQQAYENFRQLFEDHGFWAIVSIGVVPIPFQIAMITAGVAGYSFFLFLLASTIARGIRYFGLALLVLLFGKRAQQLWDQHSRTVGFSLLGAIIIGFLAFRLAPQWF